MGFQKKLNIIAPHCTFQVEEFINITQDHFEISLLSSQSEMINLKNNRVEILQCFNKLNPWEIFKITPWLMQNQNSVFHFFLNDKWNYSQWIGLTTLLTIIKSFPQSQLTYSLSIPLQQWQEFLLKPFFESVAPLKIWSPSNQLELSTLVDREKTQTPLPDTQKYWVIPMTLSSWSEWQEVFFKTLFTFQSQSLFAIAGWGDLPLRKRNLWRTSLMDLSRIKIPFNTDWGHLNVNANVIILAGAQINSWTEVDLIRLALQKIILILDEEQVQNLEGPWQHKDQFWLIRKNYWKQDLVEFLNCLPEPLHFQNLDALIFYQDHKNNQLIRALSEAKGEI